MLQNSLFKNMPKLEENIREKNKNIREKTKGQTTKAGSVTVRSTNKLQQTIQLIKQTAGERLKHEEGKYLLIRDEKSLVEYVDKIIQNGICGIDTETTGLDPIEDHLVGTVLYTPGVKSSYIPHKHIYVTGSEVEDQVSYEIMAREMQRMEDAGVKFIFHNAKFDIRFIINWLGVTITAHWDTSLASNFLNENEPHGLKALHDKYVAKNLKEDKELNTFNSLFDGISFNYVPIEIGYLYAAKDGIITYELYEFQLPYLTPGTPECQRAGLDSAAKLYLDTEVPLIKYLVEMEEQGVYVNAELGKELSEKYTKLMIESEYQANVVLKKFDYSSLPADKKSKLGGEMVYNDVIVPSIINVGSPTQLAIVMYDVLGLKSPDRNKPRGTGEDILEGIASKVTDPTIKELFNHILDYRGHKKLLSTYIDKMPAIVKEKTGRLHGSFNQYGAKTGRFSSSDPNLQNIPSRGAGKVIRKMFHGGEGYVLVGSDFSQQEPRVLAHLTFTLFGDSKMKDAYDSGLDLYSWMASEVYAKPYEACMEFHPETGEKQPEGKVMRDSVKSIILGLMYGRGTQAVADQLNWTKERAQEVIDMFFDRFPAIKQVINHYKQMAITTGYVQTVYGRKRRLPEINLPEYGLTYEADGSEVEADVAEYYIGQLMRAYGGKKNVIKQDLKKQGIKVADNGGKIADAERQTMNSVVQGSSADITKRAMVDIGRNERFREIGAQMILTVHDEIIARAPEEHALEAAEIMTELMINSCVDLITVGMKCDAEILHMWAGDDITKDLEEKYGKTA